MASEIRHLADLPLDGFVVGALRDGLPDLQALPAFRLAAGHHALTFHRAFDDCSPQASEALKRLQDHGFDRILTAGGPGKAIDFKSSLQKLVEEAAAFDLKIIAGGGVRSSNLAELKELNALTEFHSAASQQSTENPRWPEDPVVDPEEVARMRKVLEADSAGNG
jgi:copper homeostasis protein